jgi:cold shock CspA family protein
LDATFVRATEACASRRRQHTGRQTFTALRSREAVGDRDGDEKGYGRITADDGEVLFVHFSGIVRDGSGSLDQGDRVSFMWNGGIVDHGRHVAEDCSARD